MKPRTLHRGALSAALLAALAGMAQAQEPRHLADVVVSATGREQPIQDVQASVQVFTRSDIEKFAGGSVTEVLRQASGLDARSSGANGTISIRGNASTATLLLVDGLRRPGKYDSSNLNLVPFEDVERIEIIRGPLSALYGADAVGGVVNIITRKPDGKAPHSVRALAGTATTGQRNTLILGSSLNFSTGDIQHRLGLESREISPLRYNRGSLADDLSGVSHQSVNYQGLLRLGAHSFGLTLEASRQDDNRDNFATVGTRTVPYEAFEKESRQFAALRYNGEVGPGALEMVGAFSRSDGATNRSGPGTNETTLFKQTQFQARYFLERGQHGLTFGAGADRSDVNIAINSRSATRNVEHVLVQDQWHFDPKWNLVAGVRADHYSDFGSTTNPRVSIARTDGPLTLRAGYGSAFQAPTLVQQYSSFTRGRFIILGTPGLQPEKSRTTELGARYALAAGAVDAVLFRSRVSDRIESYQTGALVGSLLETRYRNISRANLSGGELNLTWQPAAGVALKAGVDLLNARNGDTGARLTGSARQTYRLSARYALGAWSFEGRARHLRDYYQIDPVARGAAYYTRYTVADLRADYTLGARTVLFLGLDNLFDRNVPNNWSGTGGFEDPGKRFGYAGIRQSF